MVDASAGVASGMYYVFTGKLPMEDLEDESKGGTSKGGRTFGSIDAAYSDLNGKDPRSLKDKKGQ